MAILLKSKLGLFVIKRVCQKPKNLLNRHFGRNLRVLFAWLAPWRFYWLFGRATRGVRTHIKL